MKIILPGQTIGIIGGGQLGRMLAMSAKEMGYKIAILDPSKDACARHFADTFIHADFDNRKGLERLCQISDVVTFEFENIDSDLLAELEKDYHIVQSASLLKTAQHRLLEKEFARSLGIETVDYQYVDGDTAGVQVDGTYLMKTVRFGYDGKGQSQITEASQVQPYTLLERLVPLDKEISVVAYKDRTGIGIVAVVENEHRHNILYRSIVPTTASSEQEAQAIDYTRRILEAADYYGVLTVEFFISQGCVIFNEMAPRVHNSGHITMQSANKSQFRAHIEAICGLEVGPIQNQATTLYNILGQDLSYFLKLIQERPAHLHLYEKEPRQDRKIGHINFPGHIRLEEPFIG